MSSSRRTVPLPGNWHAIVPAILARDPVCRWGALPWEEGYCRSDSTEVDHMGSAADHRPEVLRGICHYHHLRRTSAQGNAAAARMRSLKYRPAEKHPGFTDGTAALRTAAAEAAAEGTTAAQQGTTAARLGTAHVSEGTAYVE
jgi:hypothetical protein